MPTPLTLEAFQTEFNRGFKTQMAEHETWASSVDPSYAELINHITILVARGGKRLRPYLMYLGMIGHGEPDDPAIIQLTTSMELYHNAWLIHDDLIDRDLVRHGGPNIAGTYRTKLGQTGLSNAAHFADSVALLAGDICLLLANNVLLTAPYPAPRIIAATRRLQKVGLGVTGGEMLDELIPAVRPEKVTQAGLLNIYRHKTAAYTFELPLHIGAILAGASGSRLTVLSNFALPIGIAFQVADDLLGTFGDSHKLGKPTLSDLREGKRTLLLYNAFQLATPAAKRRLKTLVGNPNAGPEQLAEFQGILEDSGARAKTETFAREQLGHALEALSRCQLTPEVEFSLRNVAEYAVSRHL